MSITVNALTRFPVKGLSGESFKSVKLHANQGFPNDRRFGFARPDSGFDPDNPKPLQKSKFYMLARDASLVLLNTSFNDENGMLSMTAGNTVEQFDITTDQGKNEAGLFLKSYLSLPENESPQLFEASPHRFTDVSVDSKEMMNAVSLVNLDSVDAFSTSIGQEVDPRRFRANIHVSGLAPFTELDMAGQQISIGDVQLKIVQRTKRCPATQVDLNTGERNMRTPKLLLEQYGHMDMGVYAEVVEGGEIALGSKVTIA